MIGKLTGQEKSGRSRVVGWSPAAAATLKAHVKNFGSQDAVAKAAGISRPSLVEVLAGRSTPTNRTLEALCEVIGVTPEAIIESGATLADTRRSFAGLPVEMVDIPALNVRACAGDGSISYGAQLGSGPFRFASSWLHHEFGSIDKLRMIQIKGDSQLPDLTDGDWVMIDESRNQIENGLAVVLLDDCLMIKRLHREGHFLQLVSRNPIYAPTAIDLSKEEYRLRVIGKAVYVFKSV